MVKGRLICTGTLASPQLPICFFTDFMKDMNCIAARLLWLHLQHLPCAFPSLSLFTAVSVSARKGKGYFMAMQMIALHSALPVMSPICHAASQNTLSRDSWWLSMLFMLCRLLPWYHCHKARVFGWDGTRKSFFAFSVSFVSVCLQSHNFSCFGAFQWVWYRKELLDLHWMLPTLQCHDQHIHTKKAGQEPRQEQEINNEESSIRCKVHHNKPNLLRETAVNSGK